MKKKTAKVYSWSAPGRFSAVKAEVLGPWLGHLPDRRPETFVNAARDPHSPAHPLFEWNNDAAAHEHRLTTARVIYANLVVDVITYVDNVQRTHRVKAIHRTSRAGDYDEFEVAFSSKDKRNYVLAQALAQLEAIKRRYETLTELADVFAAIDKTVTRVGNFAKKPRRAAKPVVPSELLAKQGRRGRDRRGAASRE